MTSTIKITCILVLSLIQCSAPYEQKQQQEKHHQDTSSKITFIGGSGMYSQRQIAFENLEKIYNNEKYDTTITNVTNPYHIVDGTYVGLKSAYFDLMNIRPSEGKQQEKLARYNLCHQEENETDRNAIAIIFSHEVDIWTVQAGDFRVYMKNGDISQGANGCVSFLPLLDQATPHRPTVILSGNYTDPYRVEVKGNILSKDHTMNFQNVTVNVTTFDEVDQDPFLLWVDVTRIKETDDIYYSMRMYVTWIWAWERKLLNYNSNNKIASVSADDEIENQKEKEEHYDSIELLSNNTSTTYRVIFSSSVKQ